ncbi:unnamed protein product [Allacma fusca]|uniref:Uncharacterized protein n=1 Tax=Allacma fusca TaxID=39272 RepID=A0A8J2PPM0_9HEXA|nr:unnamed protein product [Allacma fusca]
MINCLQAVAIFVIYACKSSNAAALRKRYPTLKPLLNVLCAKKNSVIREETRSTELSVRKRQSVGSLKFVGES